MVSDAPPQLTAPHLKLAPHSELVIWLAGTLLAVYGVLYSGLALSADQLEQFSSLWAEPILLAVVVMAVAAAGARAQRAAERHFWLLLTAAFGCWLVANLLPLALRLPVDSLLWAAVDGLFLISFALCFLALEERPHLREFHVRQRIEYGFGALGTLLFMLVSTVSFFVIPYAAPGAAALSTWVLIVCLDGLLAVRFALLMWRCADATWRLRYALFAGASVLWIVADSLEAAVQVQSIDLSYGTPLDFIWYLPFLVVVVAASIVIPGVPDREASAPRDQSQEADTGLLLLLYAVLLPAMYLIVGATITVTTTSRRAEELTVLGGLVAFVGLAVIRHFALQRQARSVTSELTALANRERTHELQRMEAIGRLAGGVAHDLNNILQAVVSHAEAGERDPGASATSREHFNDIRRVADRAASLTAQLLAFGRRQVLTTQDIALAPLIERMMSMLRRIVGEHIELRFAGAECPVGVTADPAQIEQVVLNLVVNARDAMPSGGVIAVTLAERSITPAEAGSTPTPQLWAEVTVTDSGAGMDEDTARHVFEPFFTTKSFGQGTGLGLAMVHGIVQQHGGWVEVESAPGRGSTFRVVLPAILDFTDAAGLPVDATPPTLAGNETILVAEDDPDVREQLVASLREVGYSVVCATDGREAVEAFRSRPEEVDLLVLDAVMPRCGGREALAQIDAIRPGIPVVFSTGYDSSLIDDPSLDPARATVLQKPYSLRQLLITIRRSLDDTARPV